MSGLSTMLAVPTRACEPWCEDGDHSTQHPEDRSCWSTYEIVPLSTHRAEQTCSGKWLLPYLNVYLRRRAAENRTLVYVHSEETDAELCLTLKEARLLAEQLHQALEVAASGSVEVSAR